MNGFYPFLCFLSSSHEKRFDGLYTNRRIRRGDIATFSDMYRACRLDDRFVVFGAEPTVYVAYLWGPTVGFNSVEPQAHWTYTTEDQAIGITLSKWDLLCKS